jgi:hypothetical protein
LEEQSSQEQIIYLEPDDDIVAIREALAWTKARRVVLVIPPALRTLQSKVNLKLLHRHGANLGKEVVLVTADRLTRELGYDVGLPIFFTVDKAARARVNGPTEPQNVKPYQRRVERPRRSKSADAMRSESPFLANQIIAILLFAGILLIVAASGFLLLPGANITVVQSAQPIERTVELRADPNAAKVDYDAKVIPARLLGVEVEASTQVPTSAKKDSPDTRALGKVVFVNQLNQPVTVAVGTVVATSAGTPIRFTTVEQVTLPAQIGGTVEASVVATDPGPSGNVKSFLNNIVEGPLASQVKVVNQQPMGGGNVRQVGVVTQADKDQVKAILLQQLQQKANAALQAELGEQEFIPPETIKIFPLDETYDRFVGEQADALGLKIRVAARGSVIGGHNANALVLDQLEKNIDPKFQLLPQGLTFQPAHVVSVGDDGVAVFNMRVTGNIGLRLPKAEAIQAIQGKPIADAADYLTRTYGLKRPAEIVVMPDWLGRVPFFPFRIQLTVKTEAV